MFCFCVITRKKFGNFPSREIRNVESKVCFIGFVPNRYDRMLYDGKSMSSTESEVASKVN